MLSSENPRFSIAEKYCIVMFTLLLTGGGAAAGYFLTERATSSSTGNSKNHVIGMSIGASLGLLIALTTSCCLLRFRRPSNPESLRLLRPNLKITYPEIKLPSVDELSLGAEKLISALEQIYQALENGNTAHASNLNRQIQDVFNRLPAMRRLQIDADIISVKDKQMTLPQFFEDIDRKIEESTILIKGIN